MKTLLLIAISTAAIKYGNAQEVKQSRQKENSTAITSYFTQLSQTKFYADTVSPIKIPSSLKPQSIIVYYKIPPTYKRIIQPTNYNRSVYEFKFAEYFATAPNRFNYPNYNK